MTSALRKFTVRIQQNTTSDCVSAFRIALEQFGTADIAEFLPPPQHPKYLETLSELVRLELAHGWKLGTPTPLEGYRERYPDLFANAVLVFKLAQDEFNLRQRAGEHPSESEYRRLYNLQGEPWPTMRLTRGRPSSQDFEIAPDGRTVRQSDTPVPFINDDKTRCSNGAARPEKRELSEPEIFWLMNEVMSAMPEIGTEFHGFRLVSELGKGAFGKVFLAEQGGLAKRQVALKVASDLFGESQTLAQLQHTHIMPIYSFHAGQPFQAVCMPYLGSMTLAHVLQDIRSHHSLPSSGKDLLSTLHQHTVRDEGQGTRDERNAVVATPMSLADAPCPVPLASRPSPLAEPLLEMSYVDAILWLAVRLADGLAHAHERGIIHRDLKPANILLTEDGLPMLLDFNLAQNPKLRGSAAAASIGGTLPYMSPEHLDAFRTNNHVIDARSDVYSLGVILFELLTGAAPFPTYRKKPMPEILDRMIQDRHEKTPGLRKFNKAIPPAVEAIIRRCLEGDLAKRYQSAADLKDDLQRQLSHQPLKHAGNPSLLERAGKFRRRHPRISSASSVAAVAVVVLAGLASLFVASEDRRSLLEAQATLARFDEGVQTTCFLLNARSTKQQFDEGDRSARATLGEFNVLANPNWRAAPAVQRLSAAQQERLQEEVGQMLVLLAHAQQLAGEREDDPKRRKEKLAAGVHFCSLAADCYRDDRSPRALWQQQGDLFRALDQGDQAQQSFERAKRAEPKTTQDRFLSARLLAEEGKFRAALPLIRMALVSKPQDFNLHFLQGVCHDHLNQHADAVACYRTCIALRPKFYGAYYNRGLTYLRQSDHAAALADFDQVAQLAPDFRDVYPHRAVAHEGLHDNGAALADLTTALDKGVDGTRIYFMRARVYRNVGDLPSAQKDFAVGLRQEPRDELGWIARGNAFEATDPKRSLEDFDQALAINPRSLAAMHNKAVVLARHFKCTEEAIKTLDRAVQHYPDDTRPLTARGIYRARLGRRDAAIADAEEALRLDAGPLNLYLTAGIYALTSRQSPDDQKESLRLLSAALRKGCGHEFLEMDRDLDPVRESPQFRRVIEASRTIQPPPSAKRS